LDSLVKYSLLQGQLPLVVTYLVVNQIQQLQLSLNLLHHLQEETYSVAQLALLLLVLVHLEAVLVLVLKLQLINKNQLLHQLIYLDKILNNLLAKQQPPQHLLNLKEVCLELEHLKLLQPNQSQQVNSLELQPLKLIKHRKKRQNRKMLNH
jgi:hypothetical protein